MPAGTISCSRTALDSIRRPGLPIVSSAGILVQRAPEQEGDSECAADVVGTRHPGVMPVQNAADRLFRQPVRKRRTSRRAAGEGPRHCRPAFFGESLHRSSHAMNSQQSSPPAAIVAPSSLCARASPSTSSRVRAISRRSSSPSSTGRSALRSSTRCRAPRAGRFGSTSCARSRPSAGRNRQIPGTVRARYGHAVHPFRAGLRGGHQGVA